MSNKLEESEEDDGLEVVGYIFEIEEDVLIYTNLSRGIELFKTPYEAYKALRQYFKDMDSKLVLAQSFIDIKKSIKEDTYEFDEIFYWQYLLVGHVYLDNKKKSTAAIKPVWEPADYESSDSEDD